MKRTFFAALGLLLLSASSFCQTTAVPPMINFQGRLTNPSGNPISDGTYTLTFRIYDAQTGGNLRWTEQIGSVTSRNGIFGVLLGNTTPLSETVFNGTVWLEIQVNNQTPLIPRQKIVSVPTAFKSNLALTVPDGTVTASKIADGSVTSSKVSLPLTLTAASSNPLISLRNTGSGQGLEVQGSNNGAVFSAYNFGGSSGYGIASATLNGTGVSATSNFGTGLYAYSEKATAIIADGTGGTALEVRGILAYNRTLSPANITNGAVPRDALLQLYQFDSLSWSGIGVDAQGSFWLRTGTTESHYLTVQRDGKVGINNAAPGDILDVNGTARMKGFRLTTAATAGSVLTADANGVGTWQPIPPLADGSITTAKIADGAVTNSKIAAGTITTDRLAFTSLAPSGDAGGDLSGTYPNPAIAPNAVNSSKLTSDANSLGKVSGGVMTSDGSSIGIGTTTGSFKLNLNGGQLASTAGSSLLLTSLTGLTSNGVSLNTYLYRSADGTGWETAPIIIQRVTDVTGQAMISLYGNNVGIGTATPAAALDVNGTIHSTSSNIAGDASIGGFLTAGSGFVDAGPLDASNGALWVEYVTDRRVGIATRNPQYRLDVNGQMRVQSTVYSSDLRYKKNITNLPDALNVILNMRGVSYEWDRKKWADKDFAEGRQIGFIAQEVEKVLPDLVFTDGEGYKSVAYVNVIPVLVEAVKVQQKEIETLKKQTAEMADLKAQMAQMAAQMREMKANQETARTAQK